MRGSMRWILLLMFAAGLAGTMACRPPADETEMEALRQEIEALNADINALKSELPLLQDEVDKIPRLEENMVQLSRQPAGGASPAQVQQLEQRLARLEAQLEEVSNQAAAAARRTPLPAASTPRAGGASTPPTVTPRAASTPTPAPTPEPNVTADGSYYTAQQGETFESIAQAFGTTAQAIRDANRLPAGAMARPGQSYFIPGKPRD